MNLSLNLSISLFLSRCLNLSSSLDLSISLSYDLARSLYLCTSLAAICAIHQYQVVGRALPMETDQHPKIYRMKLWATNEVRAKSKFWYFLRKLKKVKKSNGQMLAINEAYVYLSHRVLDEIRVDVASQLSAGIQRKNSWKEDRGC
ncbi:uncharacterized protein LOC114321083 isoform X1 [Camellia sinensis]|uniref:uncharacterized protein LOC114260048 isoform X1 n=2 Tax=Camellia sinensis TaxID=4442 RepID=UPI001035756D|nr:uncharacterized protein LOC114260048 isoform X1 [Camellia sinensis]XP_028055900.1 uncharacterized protein LOC114260048 isoform X1 [Camellia sinensis]XP_028055901.1 uncharacterized protein LOC114260048 isoform X1 [Camellia sinensis]XP_028124013.1 uncharacterized protein LOC114321083 isoform X1 [Camellia sinensis]XP_028124015.1 uncharacterized protein LOC114321083 isoform X1 [Camellia sinensis]XP_028124016.1 uncharacterized protein LOC114321083 isoform X1 [Camellia sinensis]